MPVFELGREILFPDPSMAERDGLLAVGGDLSPGRLLSAYSLGIFPWYSEGDPILWWSPDPRLVLIPGRFRVSHSLRQKLSKNQFRVTFDRNFREVIEQCSKVGRRDQAGTWITPEMTDAYVELHRMGYAHSVECFHENELAGLEQGKWEKLSDAEKEKLLFRFNKPVPEKKITQEMRQKEFDNYQTTDDHGMLLTGIATDQNGNEYYIVKNSWGSDEHKYHGLLYASKPYVRLKTMDIMVHKDAIPKDIRKKLGL